MRMGSEYVSQCSLQTTHRRRSAHPPSLRSLQVAVPSHPGPLMLLHLLTAGEPGAEDCHIATLPLLVLPQAACEEVGLPAVLGGQGLPCRAVESGLFIAWPLALLAARIAGHAPWLMRTCELIGQWR